MKGRIDERGLLECWKRGQWIDQFCPWQTAEDNRCGDWCPLFEHGEDAKAVFLHCVSQFTPVIAVED